MIYRGKARAKHRAAFTLPEILVVVGILMILATLLFAVYRRTMEAAEGAANLSNHSTIARGLLAYAGDHGGRLPWANDLSKAPATTDPYPKTLCIEGYISDGRVFFNAKFWRRAENKDGGLLVINNPAKYVNAIRPWGYTTYGANRYGAMPTSTDGRSPANLARVGGDGNLSKLMLIRDVYQPVNDTPSNRLGGGTWWFANDGYLPNEDDTYGGMVHASFADGHVEGFLREKMAEMMKSGTAMPLFNNVYTRD